ncbi:MAG: class I SAM-dependent methyltransferase [Candidatus Bathyarchaeia archaeon]
MISKSRWQEAQKGELSFWLWIKKKNEIFPAESLKRFYECLLLIGDRNKFRGKLILDVGSGPNGGILNFIEDAVKVAVDPMLKHGLFKIKNDIEGVIGIGESLPFPDGKFNMIFAINMLDHVYNPLNVLMEFNRVLSKRGLLCLMVNILKSWEKALNIAVERPLRRMFRAKNARLYNSLLWYSSQMMKKIKVNIYEDADGHPFYFTHKQVMDLLGKSGFHIIKLKVTQPENNYKQDLFALCLKS